MGTASVSDSGSKQVRGGWFDLIPLVHQYLKANNNYTAYLRHRLNRFDSTVDKKTVYRWQDCPKQRMPL